MSFKNWSLVAIAAMLVAPMSANALGLELESMSVASTKGGTTAVMNSGDVITFNLRIVNPGNVELGALGIAVTGYDEGNDGSRANNHLRFAGSTGSEQALSGTQLFLGNIIPDGTGLANSTQTGVELGAPFPFNDPLRAIVFNGLSTNPPPNGATGDGLGDWGIGNPAGINGFDTTGNSTDVHIQVSFLARHLNTAPTQITLDIGTGFGGNEAVGAPGGQVEAFTNFQHTVTVVPEPGTALLMGLGLAGLATQRRR